MITKKLLASATLSIAMVVGMAQNQTAKTYPNDPFKLKEYKLKNGLTVFMSVYKDAPRVYTMTATKAGSKNDPADATGLAHYLEHMLFKGTDKLGTKDFLKEEPLVNAISDKYEVYRKTKDDAQRKGIYHQIDSLSGVAATFAIANEYDKLCSSMGLKGTNAFTSFEQTVYVNDVPSNEIDNWLTLEAERYRKPVLRLFHTELEAVYEEKNRGLDSDGNKVFEALFEGMFKNHTYGTQTTIGTIDHLKNPSMKKIMEYFNKYYVPNNMAIIITGDVDPDKTLKEIEQKFAYMQAKPVPTFTFAPEAPITAPIVREVYGPDAENVMFAYRFGGINTVDADMIKLICLILSNGKAGLMDINLNQQQQVLEAQAFDFELADYSVLAFTGKPKQDQKLDDVVKLIKQQIQNIKDGKFEDWLIQANLSNLKLNLTKSLENNQARAGEIMTAFTSNETWEHHIGLIDRLSKITKQQLIDFAKKNLNDNYVIVNKHTGEDKNMQKVDKPAITPVTVNREDQSPFLKDLMNKKPAPIQPVFIDYNKDITKANLSNGISVVYNANKENATFDLYYTFDMGSNNNKMIPIALEYLKYLGTSKYTPAQLQEEFYKLACSFDVITREEQTFLSLSGLSDNFTKALDLFEHMLANVQPNQEALTNLVGDMIKQREDAKLNKGVILRKGLVNYATYGAQNPFTNVFSDDNLKQLKAADLISVINSLTKYEHRILYYGPLALNDATAALQKNHFNGTLVKPATPINLIEQKTGSQVYVVDYDMKQAEIMMLGKGEPFSDVNIASIKMYNEYFGGNMSSILFQELRESKALAYSVSGSYRLPNAKNKSFYVSTYIGSQADKLGEALQGMSDLIKDLPKADVMFESAKDAIISGIRNERLTKMDLLISYETNRRLGLNYDVRKTVFDKVQTMTFADVQKFQQTYVKNVPLSLLIVGKKDLLDAKTLEKYGQVKYLTLKEVFGY
ncbi:MAG TPA: insulinase family protein [Bacteroidia bacterium]|nr:insulinase family protein [Bacteroidia bacterium]